MKKIIVLICILTISLTLMGQDKNDSLPQTKKTKFFNISFSYCIPSIGQIGIGYNLKEKKHRFNLTTEFTYHRSLSQNYYGFETGIGYSFGEKFFSVTSFNYMVLFNERQSFKTPKPIGPPPNYHTVWQQIPNIEIGAGYSEKKLHLTLTGKLITYSFSKQISFSGETYIDKNQGFATLIIPCLKILYKI